MEEKRLTPRFPFAASAEVITANLVESTLLTELSLYGCYLEARTPMRGGTRVTVKIVAGGEFFEATATVLYSRPTLGMGLGFRDVKPAFQVVLCKWLQQALDKYNAPHPQFTMLNQKRVRSHASCTAGMLRETGVIPWRSGGTRCRSEWFLQTQHGSRIIGLSDYRNNTALLLASVLKTVWFCPVRRVRQSSQPNRALFRQYQRI